MSPELRVMVFPHQTYTRLLLSQPRVGGVAALGRPVFSAIVLATSTAIWATTHVSVRLVLSLLICWSVAILVQVAAATALIAPARRAVRFPVALDLLFVAHGPWSLWLIGSALWVLMSSPLGRPAQFHAATGLVPAIWTAILVFVFCRTVLTCGRREAAIRTLVHQAIVFGATFAIMAWAVQLWPRIEALVR